MCVPIGFVKELIFFLYFWGNNQSW